MTVCNGSARGTWLVQQVRRIQQLPWVAQAVVTAGYIPEHSKLEALHGGSKVDSVVTHNTWTWLALAMQPILIVRLVVPPPNEIALTWTRRRKGAW
eukprot:5642378-Pleurochrysis_carterae.AAC.1